MLSSHLLLIYTNCQLPHGSFRRKCKHCCFTLPKKICADSAPSVVPWILCERFRFQHIGSSVNLILFAFCDGYGVASMFSMTLSTLLLPLLVCSFFSASCLSHLRSPIALSHSLSIVLQSFSGIVNYTTMNTISSEANFCDLMNHLANILSCDTKCLLFR